MKFGTGGEMWFERRLIFPRPEVAENVSNLLFWTCRSPSIVWSSRSSSWKASWRDWLPVAPRRKVKAINT